MPAPGWLTERPVAHRGLHDAGAGIPENSLAAARAAIEAGYAIECDVRPAADGTAMVFHDADLARLTGETGRLIERAPGDLARLRLMGTGEHVATLDELLDTIAGRAGLFVEIKAERSGGGRFERDVGARLAAYRGPAAMMSFEPASIMAAAQAAPEVPRGLVSMAYTAPAERERLGPLARWSRRNLIAAVKTRAGFVAYDAGALPATAPALARMAGLALLTWTVRSKAQAERAARHADQIIFEGFRP